MGVSESTASALSHACMETGRLHAWVPAAPACTPPHLELTRTACTLPCMAHRRCIASKSRLQDSHLDDRSRGLTEEQILQIKVHFTTSEFSLCRTWTSPSGAARRESERAVPPSRWNQPGDLFVSHAGLALGLCSSSSSPLLSPHLYHPRSSSSNLSSPSFPDRIRTAAISEFVKQYKVWGKAELRQR